MFLFILDKDREKDYFPTLLRVRIFGSPSLTYLGNRFEQKHLSTYKRSRNCNCKQIYLVKGGKMCMLNVKEYLNFLMT